MGRAAVLEAPLTIIPTATKQGRSLAQAVADLAANEGYAVQVARRPTQPEVLEACLGPGVVVFDATVEPNDQHSYNIAMYALKSIPFALVVSRSYLPTNFMPGIEGGCPPYPRTWTNEEILQWLGSRLHEMRPLVPRPARLQGEQSVMRLLDLGVKLRRETLRRQATIFISYRGTQEEAVARVAELTQLRLSQKVRFLSAGELAPPNELMSTQDRWTVMRSINDWLAASKEVWIFWSSDYMTSWWTKAELTLLAGQFRRMRARVRLYDEQTDTARRLYGVWLANIGSDIRDKLAERLLIARNPEWLSRSDRSTAVPGGLDRHGSQQLTTHQYRDDLIFSCPSCAARANRSPSPRAPRYFGDLLHFDLREVVDIAGSGLQVVSRDSVAASITAGVGVVVCPGCQSEWPVREGPPRYWFYPARPTGPSAIERGTGPGGIVLERRPVYLLEPV